MKVGQMEAKVGQRPPQGHSKFTRKILMHYMSMSSKKRLLALLVGLELGMCIFNEVTIGQRGLEIWQHILVP